MGAPRVAVLGAGPAGLAAADTLQRGGCTVTVYDAGPEVGGLARSFDLWGFRVDLGSHIYAEGRSRADALWHRVIGQDCHRVVMRRSIVSGDRVFKYPLEPLDTIQQLGPRELVRLGAGYLQRPRGSAISPESSDAWMTRRWGRPFADAFFRDYAEKLLGIPCEAVDAVFARALFGSLDLASGFQEAVRRVVGVRSGWRGTVGGTSLTFPHPTDGSGTFSARLARNLTRQGAHVRLSERVSEVSVAVDGGRDTGRLQITTGRASEIFDGVVSSLPLPVLARCVPALEEPALDAARRLRVRSTVLVYLDVPDLEGFPEQWRYLYDHVAVGRVANVRSWWPSTSARRLPVDRTVLCAELWCNADDATWLAADEDLVSLVRSDLVTTRVLSERDQVMNAHVERVRGTHPVPHLGIERDLARVRDALSAYPNLVLAGRHASFGMADQGEVIESAIDGSERLLVGLGV